MSWDHPTRGSTTLINMTTQHLNIPHPTIEGGTKWLEPSGEVLHLVDDFSGKYECDEGPISIAGLPIRRQHTVNLRDLSGKDIPYLRIVGGPRDGQIWDPTLYPDDAAFIVTKEVSMTFVDARFITPICREPDAHLRSTVEVEAWTSQGVYGEVFYYYCEKNSPDGGEA